MLGALNNPSDPGSLMGYYRHVLTTCAIALFFCLVILVWRSISQKFEAETTLQAYLTTLDVLEVYLKKNPGKWPSSWDDLEQISPSAQGGSLQWPEDIAEFRSRVQIDFDLTRAKVAAMDVLTFSAVRQIGPNFGPYEPRIELGIFSKVSG